jgi:hypothetical protein
MTDPEIPERYNRLCVKFSEAINEVAPIPAAEVLPAVMSTIAQMLSMMSAEERKEFAEMAKSSLQNAIDTVNDQAEQVEAKTIRHTAKLPFGYEATFIWRDGDLNVQWAPEAPRIESSRRAQRKFREAYNAARRSFYRDVATCIGGAVVVADVDGEMETIMPATKQ